MERKIVLEEIDPVEIYGVNNKLFDLLASHFPKIRAVARGSEINVVGPDAEADKFEKRTCGDCLNHQLSALLPASLVQ